MTNDKQIWESEAVLTLVPTAAGASGSARIQKFMAENESFRRLFEQPQPLDSTINSKDEGCWVKSLNEFGGFKCTEFIVKFQHDQQMNWILPGVKPTGRTLTLPIVVIESQNTNQELKMQRVYWDQASVLRQIYLLPSDVKKLPMNLQCPVHAELLPVVTFDSVQRLMFESQDASANPLVKQLAGEEMVVDTSRNLDAQNVSVAAHNSSIAHRDEVADLLSGHSQPEATRSSTRLNSSHVGGESHVFQNDSVDCEKSESAPLVQRHQDPLHTETHFALAAGICNENQATLNLQESGDMQLGHHGKRLSQLTEVNHANFSWEHDPTPHLEHLKFHKKMGQMQIQNQQGCDAAGDSKQQQHPSFSQQQQQYNKEAARRNNQSNIFSKNDESSDSIWSASSNGLGGMQNRSSSRVLNVPGGQSSIQFA